VTYVADEAFKHYILSRSSVTHFATNYRPTRGIISLYDIAGLICEVSEEVATYIAKIDVIDNPISHDAPTTGTPRISACTLYFQKLESLA